MRVPCAVAALAFVAGCTPVRNFVYGPTPTQVRVAGPEGLDERFAARYLVPPDDPRGDVELAVDRFTTVREHEGRHARTVHVVVVAMVVHNRDAEVWAIDGSAMDAVVSADGDKHHEYPVRAYSEGEQLWGIVVEPGETRRIDLYYELPPKSAHPSVAVEWRVLTPAGPITRTTPALARR